MNEGRHEEPESLTGAGLGDADEVVPGERDRPSLGLDRSGFLEALLFDELVNPAWKLNFSECHDRIRSRLASLRLHNNLVRLPVLVDLLLGAVLDLVAWFVEVLLEFG